jgi:hypothetical protein
MSDIFANHVKNVFDNWVIDIKEKNVNGFKPVSLYVSAKLIVFAWAYATYQTHDLKNRLGNINFVNCLESIFVNKIAQIAFALYHGYSDDDILDGNSFVNLFPEARDERDCVEMNLHNGHKPVVISGTKRFNYPTVKKNQIEGQLIVYVDANRYIYNKSYISRLNIQNNSLKVTILGYVTKTDIRLNQDQKKLLDYSTIKSAYTGLSLAKDFTTLSFYRDSCDVPEYVKELKCCTTIDKKLLDIVNYLKSVNDNKPIVKIDYSALFDPIITN